MTRPIELQQMISQAKAAEKMQRVAQHQPAEEQKKFAKDLEEKSKQATEKPTDAEGSEQATIKDRQDKKNERKKDEKKKNRKSGKQKKADPEKHADGQKDEDIPIGGVVDIRA